MKKSESELNRIDFYVAIEFIPKEDYTTKDAQKTTIITIFYLNFAEKNSKFL